ncbi:hypothetical protein LBMAG27_09540 [Bacteroidota bacterium]|nr:hypothetical protein LBMAG27_09540 [Bacteroidota bacterium]
MNFNKFKIIFVLAGLFSTINKNSSAQINVSTGVTALQLAQALVGPGATVLNPVINGNPIAYGTFSNGSSTSIGIDHGILLTCGHANIPSTNTTSAWSFSNGLPGDPLLAWAGTGYDATKFEFDVVAYDSTLSFQYVFASDEYNTFVSPGGSINDAFGFYISGPGITGQQNIALLPGGVQVTMQNVNCGANSSYYICNDPYAPTSGGCTGQCPSSSASTTIEYNGYTTLLTAQANVIPCDTFHLILVISDIADGVWDSGVLIANLLAGTAVYQTVSNPIPNYPTNTIVEGCTTGEIKVKKITSSGPCSVIDTTNTCNIDTLCYHIVTSGNAIEGIDYLNLPDTVCISANDSIFYLNIVTIADGLFEVPYDTIIVDLFPILDSLDTANCPGASSFTALHAMFLLIDPEVHAMPDDTLCQSQSITLTATSNLPNFLWSPSASLSCSNCASPIATPPSTMLYIVQASLGNCVLSDTVIINVSSVPIVNAGSDDAICPGESIQLHATGANTYLWLGSGAASLSSPNIPNPIATPNVNTTYVVQGSDNLCGMTSDTVVISIYPQTIANAWPDSSVCPNQSVQLYSTGGVNYAWTGYFLNDDSLQNPMATPTAQDVVYTVTVTDVNGCSDTAQVTLHLYDEPIANAGPDFTIFLFDSIQLYATGGILYSWYPTTGLNNANIYSPIASPTLTTTYTLFMTTVDGCIDTNTMVITVKDEPIVEVPSAFSPNSDGHNDFLKVIRLGMFDLTYLRIYNRWGEVVFESHNISEWWDGKFNGEQCEVGVYTYMMEGEGYNHKHIERRGNITLVR